MGAGSDPDEAKERVLLGEALVHPQGDGTYMIHFLKEGYEGKNLRFYCLLNTEDNLLQNIASQLGNHADFIRSQFIDDRDLDDKDLASPCEKKVIAHFSGIYHRTYKAANNTFLNNFIGRKNMWGHTFGAPKIAFQNLVISGENYLAQGIVEKSKKTGKEVYLRYMYLLRTEKLCKDMGDKYKKPRKLRKYLLQNL